MSWCSLLISWTPTLSKHFCRAGAEHNPIFIRLSAELCLAPTFLMFRSTPATIGKPSATSFPPCSASASSLPHDLAGSFAPRHPNGGDPETAQSPALPRSATPSASTQPGPHRSCRVRISGNSIGFAAGRPAILHTIRESLDYREFPCKPPYWVRNCWVGMGCLHARRRQTEEPGSRALGIALEGYAHRVYSVPGLRR